MDLYNRLKTRTLIFDIFGRDIGSIVCKFIFIKCAGCSRLVMKYERCIICDADYCISCSHHM